MNIKTSKSWKTAALVALLTAAPSANAAEPVATAASQKPSFILILGDDLTWHDVGCYGSANVKTPHIDSLARDGMRFTQAYTAATMCTPCRTMLYSGLFPVKNGAHPNHSSAKPGTQSIVQYLRELGYQVAMQGKGHVRPGDSFPFARTTLPDLLRSDQPFCFVWGSDLPHSPWTTGDASHFDPKKLVIPPYALDTPETRQVLCDYYAEVEALDGEVGEILDQLKQAGKEQNTLVIFLSEQGSQLPAGKWTCYDPGMRAAVVARWPDHIKAGSVCDEIVQYVDVVPTLVAAAGGKVPAGLDGRSFLDLLGGASTGHWDYAYAVQTTRGAVAAPKGGYAVRAIRDKRYKLILNLQHESEFSNAVTRRESYWKSWTAAAARGEPQAKKLVDRYLHRPAEEFYDLQQDPWELNNLSGDPQHQGAIEKMRTELLAWMKDQGDEGVKTEMAGAKGGKDKKDGNNPSEASDE